MRSFWLKYLIYRTDWFWFWCITLVVPDWIKPAVNGYILIVIGTPFNFRIAYLWSIEWKVLCCEALICVDNPDRQPVPTLFRSKCQKITSGVGLVESLRRHKYWKTLHNNTVITDQTDLVAQIYTIVGCTDILCWIKS